MSETPLLTAPASAQHNDSTICEVCNSTAISKLYPMEMMHGKEGPFEYVYCETCGTTYQARRLDDYGRFYDAGYYSFKFHQPTTLAQRLRQFKRRLRNRYYYFGEGLLGYLLALMRPCPVNHLSRHVKLHRDMSMLEIGCGSGELLHEIADIGLQRTVGIDPFVSQSSRYKNGAAIYKASIHELSNHVQDEKFDLILFNHSLEHSLTPIKDLQEATKFLKPAGEILVRIPVSGSEIARGYGKYWWSLDAPRHIYLFSTKSISLVAEKCGLVLKRTHFEGTIDDYVASEQHRAGVSLLSEKSYVVSKSFSAFTPEKLRFFESRIAQQNKEGTAALAGFVFGLNA